MKRIGVCTYTKRRPKGTRRARRKKDLRMFRLASLIIMESYQHHKKAVQRALVDALVFGTGKVTVNWDET